MGLTKNLGWLSKYITADSNGNIGIGTTSPELKMNIVGEGGAFPATSGTSQTGALRLEQDGSNICADFGSNGASGVWLQVTNKTNLAQVFPFLLNPNGGNVLIGTTTDTTALARSLVLDNGSNCGIVFKNAGNNKGYLYNSASELYLTTIGGVIYVMAGSNGVRLNNGATSWTSNSDSRLKNINYTIENAVEKLCTLNAVSFTWKSDKDKKEVLGLIAQDVEKVFPQIIDKNKLSRSPEDDSEIDETEYLGVRYQELIPVLVKAIQELTERIKTLENK